MDLRYQGDIRAEAVDGLEERRQAAILRITTPRGKLFFAPDDGMDVRALLKKAMDLDAIAMLPRQVEDELTKDPRFTSAEVRIRAKGDQRTPELELEAEIETDLGVVTITVGGGS